jgi:hypothetical protein
MKILKQFPSLTSNRYYFPASCGVLGLFFCFLLVFSICFISREHYVYAWDYAGYYDKYVYLGELIHTGIQNFFVHVQSSLSGDYSDLAVLPLLPLRMLMGPTRIAYIVSLLIVYGFSSIFMFIYMLKKALGGIMRGSIVLVLASIVAFFLNPFFIQSLYLGYIDVFGVGFICFLYSSYYSDNELSLKRYITLGVLLLVLFLFRRWYGYWIVSFMMVLFFWQIYNSFKINRSYTAILKLITKFLVTVDVFVLVGICIARSFFLRALLTNYSDIYSAYRMQPIKNFLETLVTNTGYAPILVFIAGGYIAMYVPALRRFSLLILIQAIISLLYLLHTQNISIHMFYQLYPVLLFFMAISVVFFLRLFKKKPVSLIVSSLLLLYALFNFLNVFVPGLDANIRPFQLAFAQGRHYPLIRTDFSELHRLTDTLSDLEAGARGPIYVLSYSLLFNDDILRHFCLSQAGMGQLCKEIFFESVVDKRDGFPKQLLAARYILVRSPIQSIERQHVIEDLSADFLYGGLLSKSFDKLPYQFSLDDNSLIYIYRKHSPVPDEVINTLSKTFQTYYPLNKQLFTFSAEDINQKDSYE